MTTIKNILVTGGSGRLGDYVASYLQDLGYNVACTDVVPYKPDSENATRKIPFYKADLLDIGDCLKAILWSECDAIVHLGAITNNTELQTAFDHPSQKGPSVEGVRHTWSQPEDNTMKINTMGMYYILDAARRLGIKNFIAATSYFSYGMGFRISGEGWTPKYLPVDEEHPCEPEDTYSLSKYIGEEIMKSFTRAYGMHTIAMRLLGVYYSNSEIHKKIYKFGVDYQEPKSGVITGDTFQYVDARDIACFVGLALGKIGTDALEKYEVFNVATDTRFVPDSKPFYDKVFPYLRDMTANLGDHEGLLSVRKAKELLGYVSKYSWRNGKQE